MISFFPDLNTWLALTVSNHAHNARAWRWLNDCPATGRLFFSRYTQMGFLRLCTTGSVMGEQNMTVKQAWAVYDRWIEDDRVEFHPEPRGVESMFREAMRSFGNQRAPKAIGDCYLLAFAEATRSTLVTFDAPLQRLAAGQGARCILPD